MRPTDWSFGKGIETRPVPRACGQAREMYRTQRFKERKPLIMNELSLTDVMSKSAMAVNFGQKLDVVPLSLHILRASGRIAILQSSDVC